MLRRDVVGWRPARPAVSEARRSGRVSGTSGAGVLDCKDRSMCSGHVSPAALQARRREALGAILRPVDTSIPPGHRRARPHRSTRGLLVLSPNGTARRSFRHGQDGRVVLDRRIVDERPLISSGNSSSLPIRPCVHVSHVACRPWQPPQRCQRCHQSSDHRQATRASQEEHSRRRARCSGQHDSRHATPARARGTLRETWALMRSRH
jgi:hypothetical protein